MTSYSVQCQYAAYHYALVSVEADTIEDACQAAIDQADSGERWRSSDHVGDAYIAAICEGADLDPWNGPVSDLPIPDKFAERGELPVVTLTGPRPPGGVQVSGGIVRVRFVDDAATVTTEVCDPPPPGNKPLVTVKRRADGAPEILVQGGKVRLRVDGWGHIDDSRQAD